MCPHVDMCSTSLNAFQEGKDKQISLGGRCGVDTHWRGEGLACRQRAGHSSAKPGCCPACTLATNSAKSCHELRLQPAKW